MDDKFKSFTDQELTDEINRRIKIKQQEEEKRRQEHFLKMRQLLLNCPSIIDTFYPDHHGEKCSDDALNYYSYSSKCIRCGLLAAKLGYIDVILHLEVTEDK